MLESIKMWELFAPVGIAEKHVLRARRKDRPFVHCNCQTIWNCKGKPRVGINQKLYLISLATGGGISMNTNNGEVHVHRLEGLVVIVDEGGEAAAAKVKDKAVAGEGEMTARGDELETAEKLQRVAEVLETKHLDDEANLVKEHVRDIVAKQLNEFDGFDR
jgi:hypothetical protein